VSELVHVFSTALVLGDEFKIQSIFELIELHLLPMPTGCCLL